MFALFLVFQNLTFRAIIGTILGLVFAIVFTFFSFELMRKRSLRGLNVTRKMLSYTALASMTVFVISRAFLERSPRAMDIVLGLLWFLIFIISIITSRRLNPKRVAKYFPDIPVVTKKKKLSIGMEILDWIDAGAWAIGMVLLLNIFVFQLYAIPSESMVPTFMVGDRVIGFKTPSGPQFPLSSFKLPCIKKYKRGDVVILRSPRYTQTPESEFKTFISQLVYMVTFMQVNMNTDPSTGQPKFDPLVKRIVGMPGEKLMLVDGVLYAKRKGDVEYRVVEADKNYAQWNLEKLPKSDLEKIQRIPVNTDLLEKMETIEAKRKNIDFRVEYDNIENIIRRVKLVKNNPDNGNFGSSFLTSNDNTVVDFFTNNADIARQIMTTNGGLTWFEQFTTGWASYWVSAVSDSESLYARRYAQLNVMIKECFASLILRNMELLAENVSSSKFKSDSIRQRLLNEATDYLIYLELSSGRNMPEFPAEKNEYIPEDHYFMMGDNRFNSLDLRHGKKHMASVDSHDVMPLVYSSSIAPQSLPKEKILGSASFIIWPISRFGSVY